MLPAWVMGFPDGTESGAYLALDMGGTNLRVCEVVLLNEGRKFDMIQSKYRMVQLSPELTNRLACPFENGHGRTTFRLHRRLPGKVLER
jgi:Hexokinase